MTINVIDRGKSRTGPGRDIITFAAATQVSTERGLVRLRQGATATQRADSRDLTSSQPAIHAVRHAFSLFSWRSSCGPPFKYTKQILSHLPHGGSDCHTFMVTENRQSFHGDDGTTSEEPQRVPFGMQWLQEECRRMDAHWHVLSDFPQQVNTLFVTSSRGRSRSYCLAET